jgi:uncharacterized membrane protein
MAARKYQPRHGAPDSGDPAPKPGTKGGPGTNRRRAPQHADTVSAPKAPSGAARKSQQQARLNKVADAAREHATRQALKRTEGKPSIVGRAVTGAAAGTAAGAAVGGPVGAAAGAVIGGAGGALAGAKAKKAYKMAMHASLGARRLVVAEFLICMIVIALSPLTDKHKDESPITFMRRMTATMALFLILGLLSGAGPGAGKVAAGFGGLVSVAVALSNRDLFMKIGDLFGKSSAPTPLADDLGDEPLHGILPPGGGVP